MPLPDPAGGGDAGLSLPDPVLLWSPEDFRGASVELVELAEAWTIDRHTRRAVSGKLPKRVVDEIAKDSAFPPGSKKSLANSAPATLAQMFNALRVPIGLKSVITTAPALVYIIVRDLQHSARIEKLIADEQERERAKSQTPAGAPSA
jgi:hypothetical protein